MEEIADQLEDEISRAGCGLTYYEIVKLAIVMAIKVKSNIPMYQGNLNPKWKLWDDVIVLLNERQQGD